MSTEDAPASNFSVRTVLRAPTTTTGSPSNTDFKTPPLSFLIGTWHVTHSTLPMWKKSRNVFITYSPLPSASSASSSEDATTTKLDDLVTYQSLTSDKLKTVSGVDTPAGPGCWNWRGNGWLMIASSHWEVLGYGDEEEGEGIGEEGEAKEKGQWVVTYFEKTLFTPSGLDIYSRRKEGLKERTVERIKEALGRVDAEVVRKLVGDIFVVRSD